jgi:[acyl-carrier-protein] S-malonyltransferase
MPVPTAFLFPGQGSQKVGMGSALCAAHPDLKERLFDRADALLGFPLTQLCFHGPEEALTRTENAQPALLLVSIAALEALWARGVQPDVVAGHSLGEYSALVAAGALRFEDALRAVRKRGELMAAIGESVRGAMAAVMGLPPETIEAVCREASEVGLVQVANYNSPEQTVVSGEREAVQRAGDLAKERGAGRVVALNVSAPFHCGLMAPLREEMARVLAQIEIEPPRVPVIANFTAQPVTSPDEIRIALADQVAGAVRWTDSIRRLSSDGITRFVEVGPGRVLSGLTRRIAPEAESLTFEQLLEKDQSVP